MIGRDGTQGVLPLATLAADESHVVRSGDHITMWPTAPLESVAQIASGVTKGRRLTEPVQEVPYLRVANVQAGHLALSDIRTIPASPDEVERFRLRKGDVLMTEGGDPDKLGRGALWSGVIDPCIHQNHIFRVRLDPDAVVPEYFVQLLASAYGKQYFLRAAKQTTGIASINKTQLSAFPVPLPPLPEQRRIADILDKADAIRRKRKEAIALTEELLRSTFLDMFGDPVTNPKGWPAKPLGNVLAMPLRNGLSPASGGTFEAPVLTLSAITRGQFDPSASKLGAFAVEPWEDVRVDVRDFLICRGNGNVSLVGRAAFPRESHKGVVFPDTMIAARIDHSSVVPAFLEAIWKSAFVRRQIEAGARTTNGTYKINQGVVEGISLLLPPVPMQQDFAEIEARVSRGVRQQLNALERCDALFSSLVAGAFSGELTS